MSSVRVELPVTVAGPHRHRTGFRVSRPLSNCAANLDRDLLLRKRGGKARLERLPPLAIRVALRVAR